MPVGEPIRITIEKKPEDDPMTAYANAREKAIKYSNEGYVMKDAIIKAADEYEVDVSTLGSAVSNWEAFINPKSTFESKEDQNKRAVESGDAYIDEIGNIRYYDDRESGK